MHSTLHPRFARFRRIYLIPIAAFSLMGVIHNSKLAKEMAALKTGSAVLDWGLAVIFALGIETAFWSLIIHRRVQSVYAYLVILLLLNLLYYGDEGVPQQVVNLIFPGAWKYAKGLLTPVIFSLLLSGFLKYLSEIAIADMQEKGTSVPVPRGEKTVLQAANGEPHPSGTSQPKPVEKKQPVPVPIREGEEERFPKVSPFPVATPTRKPGSTPIETPFQVDPMNGTKRCLKCDSVFVGKRRHSKFCSSACKQAFYRHEKQQEPLSA